MGSIASAVRAGADGVRRRIVPLAASLAVAAGLLAALPPEPAEAQSCPPPGGRSIVAGSPGDDDFVVTGRGWGHGVGMSQYGARGAAALGCDAGDIVTTYFPGVSVRATDLPSTIRVGLYPDRPASAGGSLVTRLNVDAVGGDVPWRLVRGGGGTTALPTQPQGRRWSVRVLSDGRYRILDGSSEVWRGGGREDRLQVRHRGTIIRLPAKGNRYRWGTLELSQSLSGAPEMYVTLIIPSMERYLYGLAEVPSSWHEEVLRAQAIVGRSYALSRRESFGNAGRTGCRCHLYDSVWDQAYMGYEKESEGTDARWGRRWVAAVDATAGRTMRYDGGTAIGYYSSSHGGQSESSEFVWGGRVPYLRPVDDSRWELAADNPNLTWHESFSARELGSRFGVGTAQGVELPNPRGAQGRVGDPDRGAGGVVIKGTQGTRTVSGDRFRSTLGLRSTLIDVHNHLPPPGGNPWDDGGVALTGDWNGDGTATPGWFVDGGVYLRNSNSRGPADIEYRYGRAGDIPIVGDWNGDGRDTIGVIRGRWWYLRNAHRGGKADISFVYGRLNASDYPLAGDWNRDGRDTVGVVRRGEWHLRNVNRGGRADVVFVYGRVRRGDVPLVGDWNRDGRDTPGIVRGSEWHLRHVNRGGRADQVFRYGRASDTPVVGDWNGNGRTTVGVVRGSTWHLRNRNSAGPAHRSFSF